MTIVVPGGASGAASSATLKSLTASVAKWLNRTDLDPVLADFVRLAEAEFARDTRLRSSFQVALVDGYAAAGEVALPSDLLELKELTMAGRVLRELPYDDWRNVRGGDFFARVGEVVHITGKPEGAYTITYLQKLPELAFATDSNWLLREHFDMYLWKCCEIGSVYLRDAEAAVGYGTKYEAAAQQLLQAVNQHAWGGAPLAVLAPGVV
ncbi:phage adaptor protein [Alicycliphilus denitrificans]|uniref:Uncharacterized protein n=1 Tax=Alicycliphilus denitrificans TaxID=179636 RepID=A0A3R7IT14_9BURK|nr:hypothetical protein [Alicycliphilus denitrificans]RKJ96638.1 hypothetical protein CE154_011485 [Alicycliphilus denitrificans]